MRRIFTILMIAFSLSSCIKDKAVYEKNIPIDSGGWDYSKPVNFEYKADQKADTFNLFVNVRHSSEYQWRNLWVIINTELPGGEKLSKRVNLKLENPKGESFGKCTGDICFVQVPVQYNAVFPDSGVYRFSIEQSMRENPLLNIVNIGFRIEES